MVILTEVLTSGLILSLLALPGQWLLLIVPLVGLALNGTSSVLYATVADLVGPTARARAYGLFYSITTASGAVGPALYGLLGDAAGVTAVSGIAALVGTMRVARGLGVGVGMIASLWADNETTVDLLGFDYLVDSLEVVLTEPRLLPVTVGVLGDSGSGKTSLLQMVAERVGVRLGDGVLGRAESS
jgi:MFS family permease